MACILFYATHSDGQLIREWINSEDDIAWIVKVSENGGRYAWQARRTIDALFEQSYALWHTATGVLTIPSGSRHVPDAIVADPFVGWEQTLETAGETTPWFGSNLPGPYGLRFAVAGREHPTSLARSEFSWLSNRYRVTGQPAHPAATGWWNRLRRFIAANSHAVGWPDSSSRVKAYVLPDAKREVDAGRARDVNP